MIEIAVDELKANLKEYLQQVETRRRKVIARIVPAGKSLTKRMDRLI